MLFMLSELHLKNIVFVTRVFEQIRPILGFVNFPFYFAPDAG